MYFYVFVITKINVGNLLKLKDVFFSEQTENVAIENKEKCSKTESMELDEKEKTEVADSEIKVEKSDAEKKEKTAVDKEGIINFIYFDSK